jgi:hypothetical protein
MAASKLALSADYNALPRAGTYEAVAPLPFLAQCFCWSAGACCICLLLRLTRRRGFLLRSLRLSQSNRHADGKHRDSESLEHGFLPRLGVRTLFGPT